MHIAFLNLKTFLFYDNATADRDLFCCTVYHRISFLFFERFFFVFAISKQLVIVLLLTAVILKVLQFWQIFSLLILCHLFYRVFGRWMSDWKFSDFFSLWMKLFFWNWSSCTQSFVGLMCQKEFSVQYTLDVIMYSCLDGQALRYLGDLCIAVSDVSARPHLRSATRHLLVVPQCQLSTLGRRAFSVAGPSLWNSLSDSLRYPDWQGQFQTSAEDALIYSVLKHLLY